jgi:phenylacetate-CoA ligase
LAEVLPQNRFYEEKLSSANLSLSSLEELADLPYTFKDELTSTSGEFAANLTYPADRYVRYHRTSGTRGRPIVVLDTVADWEWWTEAWQFMLDAADISPADRVFMAFSFGPFIGFWSAHDACLARQAMVIPGGGLSTLARLELIRTARATVVFTTPSYALHLAEVGLKSNLRADQLGVQRIIVAGEPGGSVPAVRQRIEEAWNARLIDHAGASEVGPWG